MLKKLTSNDLEILEKVLPKSKIKEFKETFLSDLLNWNAFALIENDVPKGILSTYYSSESTEWSLLPFMYCDSPYDLKTMIDGISSYYEDMKIYKFYWIEINTEPNFVKNFLPERYFDFVEYKTESWYRPKSQKHFNTIYFSNFYSVETYVHLAVLKEEYRKI